MCLVCILPEEGPGGRNVPLAMCVYSKTLTVVIVILYVVHSAKQFCYYNKILCSLQASKCCQNEMQMQYVHSTTNIARK